MYFNSASVLANLTGTTSVVSFDGSGNISASSTPTVSTLYASTAVNTNTINTYSGNLVTISGSLSVTGAS